MPIFSVIIPVYNNENYLSQCLDSVLNQTFKDFELICVNDGSTDRSSSILNEYQRIDSRVKVINTQNNGAGIARNIGLDCATGKYISFLDSDDFFEPMMLEKSYNVLESTQVDFVVFHADRYLDSLDSFVGLNNIHDEDIPSFRPLNYRNLNRNVFKVFVCWVWDKIYRADFIRKNNLRFQDQRTSNDLLFVLSSLVTADKIEVLPDILAHYRSENMASLTNTRDKSWYCFYYSLFEFRKVLIKKGLYSINSLRQDFIDYALFICLCNLNAVKGEAKKELYNKLKNEWFDELEISKENPSFFYNKREYSQYLRIKKYSFKLYSRFDINSVKELSKDILLRTNHKNYFSKRIIKFGVTLWTKMKRKVS